MLVLKVFSVKLTGSWRFPPRFQREAWKIRKCPALLNSLQKDSGRVMCEAVKVKVKPKLQWRPQVAGFVRNGDL
jgi:hypothetical protein